MFILLALALFVVGVVYDLLYIAWFNSVQVRSPTKAAIGSMLLTTLSLFGFVNVIDSIWLAIPYVLGLGTGSFLGVYISNGRDKRNRNKSTLSVVR